MKKVTSPDGTPIAYYRSGSGSPLVLVHGTGAADPTAWSAFPLLQENFSLITVDRRGRGESGDQDTYDIEREFEDIAAVIDGIGEKVDLLGHSFGGLLALEAALRTRNIRKLILYEGVPLPKEVFKDGVNDQLQTLLDAGDREGVLIKHYREDVGMSPDEIEEMKSSPSWAVRLAAAHTVPRELKALNRYKFNPDRFQDMEIPTLLILGGDSPQFVKSATENVHKALPNSEIAVLPGQQHIAMYTSPEQFVNEVVQYLYEPQSA